MVAAPRSWRLGATCSSGISPRPANMGPTASNGIPRAPPCTLAWPTLRRWRGITIRRSRSCWRGLAATGESPELLWALANRLLDTHQLAEAEKTIEQLQGHHYRFGRASARVAIQAAVGLPRCAHGDGPGHWLAARQGFEKSRRHVLTPEGQDLQRLADVAVGVCYGRLGSVDQQIEALRRAVKTDPGSTNARLGTGRGAVERGNR